MATQNALGKTIDEVAVLTTKSEEQEDRYRDLLDVLRQMADNSTDAAKWRSASDDRMSSLEQRLSKLEDVG